MEACRTTFPVRMMARWLAVSPSGYYEWRGRGPSRRAQTRQRLLAEMRTIHAGSDGTYGSPRMRTGLLARGHQVGRHRVARLMRQARLRGSVKKRYRVPSGRRAVGPVAAHVLGPAFTPSAPNHRGSQYTSEASQRLLADHGIRCSMSGQGHRYDNACVESFFATLKRERVTRRRYATRAEARAELFDYLEVFCNRQRRHSLLGYRSPAAYENELHGLL